MFCQHCGNPTPEPEAIAEIATEGEVAETEVVASSEVRIAEIQAKRDVDLARINAGIIDADRDTALARAQGEVEALEQIIAPDPEPADPPVIIEAPAAEDPEPEGNPPPEADPAPAPSAKSSGLGWYS